MIKRQLDLGRTRQQAERDVAEAIRTLVAKDNPPAGFEISWFADLLRDKGNQTGQLKSTYTQKNLSKRKIDDLMKESMEGLPSTDIPIPKT